MVVFHSTGSVITGFVCWFVSCSAISAAVIYHESTSGDLSGAYTAPSVLTVTHGQNTIVGTVGNNGNTGGHPDFAPNNDADYFTFTIAPGQTVNSIRVSAYSATNSAGNGSFFGYKAGVSAFAGQSFGDIDGYALFSDTRDDLFANPPNTGMNVSSLSSGTYAFWVEEMNDTVISYSLTFNIVPEPSSALLVGLGLLFPMLIRRRRPY